ncbi:MAG: helix-turn-helix domain-containing protein [Candidatus Hydrogenedentota bacterium]
MNTMTDTVLTLDDAAKFLKVSPETVEGLLEGEELPGRQIGGEWRTTTRAVISFVDGVPLQVACCTSGACCTTAEGSALCCQPGETGCC